jgi:hypothetical protein
MHAPDGTVIRGPGRRRSPRTVGKPGGKGVTDMVARVVAGAERDQIEGRKQDTEGVGLEASIHTDFTQTRGPNQPQERQKPQP